MRKLRLSFITILFIFILSSCKNSGHLTGQDNKNTANALLNETSPYLLQHAYNPVNWHPWNEETLAKAKRENKLLIISIGYAACHWCHVMEHESFEDEEVAKLMNENFIPIKVDREERPDVDDIYMTACNLVSGRGGWPLNAFAMPDGRPIWAGTYFPKENWVDLLNQFINLNKNDYAKLEDSATRLTSGVKSVGEIELVKIPNHFSSEQFHSAVQKMNGLIDQEKGGRAGAPKFPMPNNYELLLKFSHAYDDKNSLNSALLTLDEMSKGGIYDQVGGGFARYSVDASWKVPHFEKMLYDNAQLVGLYSNAFKLTKNDQYKHVVDQTLEFIEREMTSSEGGFYSSLDADSEDEEGKFYVWTENEMQQELGDESLFTTAKLYYSSQPDGNWEHSNILHITKSFDAIAQQLNISSKELSSRVSIINNRLLKARENRIRPGLDDKILTGWNALMISGYVEAFKAFKNEDYLEKALQNAHFLIKNQMNSDFRLNRNYKEGVSNINAFLDDYAALIKALLDLHEVTFDIQWLNKAQGLLDYSLGHFYDASNGMFYRASKIDPPLVSKSIETSDNVIPSTNSIMARNLFRIGQIKYNSEYLRISKQLLSNLYPTLKDTDQPGFYSNWLQLWMDQVTPPFEIVITGSDAQNVAQSLQTHFLGSAIVLGSEKPNNELPLVENKYQENKTLIYVCENKVCQLPVESVAEALSLMKYK